VGNWLSSCSALSIKTHPISCYYLFPYWSYCYGNT